MRLLIQFVAQSRTFFFSTLIILLAFGSSVLAQPRLGGVEPSKMKNPGVLKKPTPGKIIKPKPSNGRKPAKRTLAEIEALYENAVEAGNLARDQRNYAAAEKAYLEGIGLKKNDFRAHYGLGNVYMDQQRWDDAEKTYREALFRAPNSADVNIALSFVLVHHTTGQVAVKLVEADKRARRAIVLEPNNAVAWYRLGVALEARSILTDETEQAFRRSTEIDPNFALAHAHLARLLWKRNKRNDAEQSYKRAIDLAQDAPTLTLIAESYQLEQRFTDSEPLLLKALQLDGKYPLALYLLGSAYVAVGQRYADAITVLRKCVETSPQAFAPQNLLASAYQRAGHLNEAEDAYDLAAKLASATEKKQVAGAYGFMGVGDAFFQEKRFSDALRCYQKALNLDPDNQEIRGKIAVARGRTN